jgi:hypothetical protein
MTTTATFMKNSSFWGGQGTTITTT